jgi:hypothetical protein
MDDEVKVFLALLGLIAFMWVTLLGALVLL